MEDSEQGLSRITFRSFIEANHDKGTFAQLREDYVGLDSALREPLPQGVSESMHYFGQHEARYQQLKDNLSEVRHR